MRVLLAAVLLAGHAPAVFGQITFHVRSPHAGSFDVQDASVTLSCGDSTASGVTDGSGSATITGVTCDAASVVSVQVKKDGFMMLSRDLHSWGEGCVATGGCSKDLWILTELTDCAADTCSAPTGVANAAASSCKGGKTCIAKGEMCEPQCAEGYAPSVTNMTCDGTFSPANFTCELPQEEEEEDEPNWTLIVGLVGGLLGVILLGCICFFSPLRDGLSRLSKIFSRANLDETELNKNVNL